MGNDTDGVTIEIEGADEDITRFLPSLREEPRRMARIDSIGVEELAVTGESGFSIVSSQALGRVSTGIPADAATCPDCFGELLDPSDRRYRYPFLNCTNCGPRSRARFPTTGRRRLAELDELLSLDPRAEN